MYLLKTSILSFVLFAVLPVYGQQQTCLWPIGAIQYNQLKGSILNSGSANLRFQRAATVVNGYCITTRQLTEIMELFPEDNLRLEIATGAYRNITNPLDFYDVYNAFSNFSSAFRLHDFVNGIGLPQQTSTNPLPIIQPSTELTFPNWSYPSMIGYLGQKNCVTTLADSDFLVYARDIQSKLSENEKLLAARLFVSGTCLGTAQVMKIASLVLLETARMEILKAAYEHIYDEASAEAASQVFSHQPNQLAWIDYIRQRRNLTAQQQVVQAPCTVTDGQYAQIKEALTRETSSITRVSVAKNQIPSYVCFTSQQMKGILTTFSSSIDKLEIAKLGYDYVSDKQNYYFTVSPVITSTIDRDELSKYIAQRGR